MLRGLCELIGNIRLDSPQMEGGNDVQAGLITIMMDDSILRIDFELSAMHLLGSRIESEGVTVII